MPILLAITCLCGAVAQTVKARPPRGADPIPITLCHCSTCRATSGVFFTSYCPIEAPSGATTTTTTTAVDLLLSAYVSSPATTRYFCKTCGCHVFCARRRQSSSVDDDDDDDDKDPLWEVATGTIVNEWRDDVPANTDDGASAAATANRPVLAYAARHAHVADTVDDGLAVWLPTASTGGALHKPTTTTIIPPATTPEDRTAAAACHCGAVQFRVRPPDADPVASRQPRSGFSDLLVPFAASDPARVANPDNVKWWLRPSAASSWPTDTHMDNITAPPTRYLAGTCACRSCRLATGFEIQTWAFVPRVNILLPDGSALDFFSNNTDHPVMKQLSTYQSSPGVERNFCSRCGATVFWHDRWRPDLIDVSAGLFRSDAGSRLESLLDWCTSRVSFAEEATRGRLLLSAQRGEYLVHCLEKGMKSHVS